MQGISAALARFHQALNRIADQNREPTVAEDLTLRVAFAFLGTRPDLAEAVLDRLRSSPDRSRSTRRGEPRRAVAEWRQQ